MNRAALTCVVALGIASSAGCSANPAYEPLFQEFVASVERAATAMQNARDAKSLKKAAEVLLTESDATDALREKIILLGKPNSASKRSVQKYIDELKALDKERTGAGDQYANTLEKVRLSGDDREGCIAAGVIYAQSVNQLGISLRVLDFPK